MRWQIESRSNEYGNTIREGKNMSRTRKQHVCRCAALHYLCTVACNAKRYRNKRTHTRARFHALMAAADWLNKAKPANVACNTNISSTVHIVSPMSTEIPINDRKKAQTNKNKWDNSHTQLNSAEALCNCICVSA